MRKLESEMEEKVQSERTARLQLEEKNQMVRRPKITKFFPLSPIKIET